MKMGIQVEFNPDLALRRKEDFPNRLDDECIPEDLQVGERYKFLKRGQRNYWLAGEIPLLETKGNQELSRPLASIKIIEVIHFVKDGEVWTKGVYEVVTVFNDNEIHFESYARVGREGE